MTPLAMPSPESIRQLLAGLLDRQVTVKPVPTTGPLPNPAVVSLYADDQGVTNAAAASDLAFACSVSAALSLLPPASISDALKAGKLSPVLFDNYREIVNVMASLLNITEGRHVRVTDVAVHDGKKPPPSVTKAASKREWLVQVAGYGNGRLLFFLNE